MVYKRDGQIQEFRPEKIENAVLKAFYDVEKEETEYAKSRAKEIAENISALDKDMEVEEIQDIVESQLAKKDMKVEKHVTLEETIMKITPKEINVFKEDFISAVKGLEKKYGVEIALENIRYTPDEKFEGKMTVTNLETKKTPEETFREESKYFRLYGVTPDMYRQIFRGADRNIYRLVGLRKNARKNIFVVTKLPDEKTQYVCGLELLHIRNNMYEKMIQYILHDATEQTFQDFMGYDIKPVDRSDVEEVIMQMPDDMFHAFCKNFGLEEKK